MSSLSIYSKASNILKYIGFDAFPKLKENDNNDFPYSKGAFVSSPIINYLRENDMYDSHSSGDVEDFGILTKTIFGIPENRFIRIKTIDVNKFKITWIVKDVDELLYAMMLKSNYDWRIFDKFGFTSKSKVIELKFDLSDDIDESPDESIVMSSIINYDELKNKLDELNIQF